MVRFGKISIQQALSQFVVKETKQKRILFKLDDKQIIVKRNSQRYILFKKKGLTCVCCGLTANKAYFEQNLSKFDISHPVHINFYLVRNGMKDLLFTKDHIIPVSKGGKDVQENYQVMCQDCNTKKGNLIEGD
jgi:5-methylcytosine-specific restriction endonuclease McrA